MRKVEVALGERSYEIVIAENLLDQAGEILAPYARRGRLVAVSDERVWAAQGERLKASGIEILPVLVPPGEGSKSWAQLADLLDRLLALEIERSDHILAFGGGMVGDLTGFAASILKRGCSFVQIPTTLLAGESEARLHAIETSVRSKAAIVGEDERETSGRRALLKLGHTVGHAFEAEAGFSDRLLHGEAVALGMALAFRFSARRGLCSQEDAGRVAAHLDRVGLPTRPSLGTPASLVAHMTHDKKASAGRVPFILARGIGEAFVDQRVELSEVESFLAEELA